MEERDFENSGQLIPRTESSSLQPSARQVRFQNTSARCVRLVGHCCPQFLRCLRLMGYEQAVIIRGWTHLALWFSLIVSFGFCAAWFTDVIQLRCTEDDKHVPSDMGQVQEWFYKYEVCMWEVIGIIVFMANFVDAARMIAHYDDDRQLVLKEKWRTLNALKVESAQVLEHAKANVDRLRGRLLSGMKSQFSSFVKEVFTIILPCLNEVCTHIQQKGKNKEEKRYSTERQGALSFLVASFADLCKDMLLEVEALSCVMFEDLKTQNPQVFDSIAKKGDQGAISFFDSDNSGQHLLIWDEWIERKFPLFSSQTYRRISLQRNSVHGNARRSTAGRFLPGGLKIPLWGKDLEKGAEPGHPKIIDISDQVVECVLQPLEELLKLPDLFAGLTAEVEGKSEKIRNKKKRQRVGFGAPPRGCGNCADCCCIPYTLAAVTRCIFCPCWPCCLKARCQGGLTHIPPKIISFGCFWIQIHTKLHERLLQGLLFSVLFCALYANFAFEFWNQWGDCVEKDGFGKCSFTLFRKGCAWLAIVFYVPALIACLCRIDRLDEVMETIETIWELEDIQRAVKAFDKSMSEVAEQVAILKAIEDRVLTRMDIVTRFGGRIGVLTDQHTDDNGSTLTLALGTVTNSLNQAKTFLGTAEDWLQLSSEEQDESVAAVRKQLDDLIVASFGMSMIMSSPESSSARRGVRSSGTLEAQPHVTVTEMASFGASSTGTFV